MPLTCPSSQDLTEGEGEWSAGAPNGGDLAAYEAWQAALGGAADGVPPEWLDPITLGVMRHPCRAADGFLYERAAIREWLQRQRAPTSPLTGAPLASRALRPDAALQARIHAELRRRGVQQL